MLCKIVDQEFEEVYFELYIQCMYNTFISQRLSQGFKV